MKLRLRSDSLLNIFPYFVLGFIGMIIFRNIGDQIFLTENTQVIWQNSISIIKDSAKIFLSMAMAAVGLSTNLKVFLLLIDQRIFQNFQFFLLLLVVQL